MTPPADTDVSAAAAKLTSPADRLRAVGGLLGFLMSPRRRETLQRLRAMQAIGSPAVTQAIYVVAQLGIADLLATGPKTSEELAQATGSHAPSLYRVLRAVTTTGLLVEKPGKVFALTKVGEAMKSGPGSARPVAILFGHPAMWRLYGDMLESVKTGKAPFRKDFGGSSFEYLAQFPDFAHAFDDTMTAFSTMDAEAVSKAYDWAKFSTILDCGGGQGNLLCAILEKHTKPRGILFDMPQVVQGAPKRIEASKLTGRIDIVPGSFFNKVPTGAEAYILSHVIHDWNDEDSLTILRNVRQAIPKGSTLLLNELVVPSGPAKHASKVTDLSVMMFGGKERTQEEWVELLGKAGFRVQRIVPTGVLTSVIEARPV